MSQTDTGFRSLGIVIDVSSLKERTNEGLSSNEFLKRK